MHGSFAGRKSARFMERKQARLVLHDVRLPYPCKLPLSSRLSYRNGRKRRAEATYLSTTLNRFISWLNETESSSYHQRPTSYLKLKLKLEWAAINLNDHLILQSRLCVISLKITPTISRSRTHHESHPTKRIRQSQPPSLPKQLVNQTKPSSSSGPLRPPRLQHPRPHPHPKPIHHPHPRQRNKLLRPPPNPRQIPIPTPLPLDRRRRILRRNHRHTLIQPPQ